MDTSCNGTVTHGGDATRLEGSAAPVNIPDFKAPEHYINRELSLLEFNQRVLAQAFDETVPLLERLKFLCISSSNLDEFFEIRRLKADP
jgi:polyphosphate kinase